MHLQFKISHSTFDLTIFIRTEVFPFVWLWFYVRLHDVRNSRNRIFAFTMTTQTCWSIKSLNYCWKSKKKSLWLPKKRSNLHLIALFEDIMFIWRYKHQKLDMISLYLKSEEVIFNCYVILLERRGNSWYCCVPLRKNGWEGRGGISYTVT